MLGGGSGVNLRHGGRVAAGRGLRVREDEGRVGERLRKQRLEEVGANECRMHALWTCGARLEKFVNRRGPWTVTLESTGVRAKLKKTKPKR